LPVPRTEVSARHHLLGLTVIEVRKTLPRSPPPAMMATPKTMRASLNV
jgi:hypothetical protein